MTDDWATTLAGHLDTAWALLAEGASARNAATRFVTLATLGQDGTPEARTVALRHAERRTGTLEIYTDTLSAKIAELSAEPRASVHVWAPGPQLQIRLRATVTVLTGAAVRARWDALHPTARLSYGIAPPPGTPIDTPHAHDRFPHPDRFAVLSARIDQIETVHLGEPAHTRALFARADGWAGGWRAP